MKFQELTAYKKSLFLAMVIFEISKSFPKEEMHSLTNQIRRASRSVPANIAEAYRKRTYLKTSIVNLPIQMLKIQKSRSGWNFS